MRREEDLTILLCDPVPLQELEKAARLLWVQHYGRARSSPKETRWDAGVKRGPIQKPGEASFLRVRAEAVSKLVSEERPTVTAMPEVPLDADLSDKQIGELCFAEKKARLSRIEALLSGYLDPTEVTDELVAAAENHIAKLAHAQQERHANRKRKVPGGNPPHDTRGARVFFAHDHVADKYKGPAMQGRQMTRVLSPTQATLIIVEDPGAPGLRMQFAAGLCGGVLATEEYFKTKGHGAAVAYCRATAIKRQVHVTFSFMEENPGAAGDLLEAMGQPLCKWKYLPDSNAVTAGVIVFLSEEEWQEGTLQRSRQRLTFRTAVNSKLICKADPRRSQTGACIGF